MFENWFYTYEIMYYDDDTEGRFNQISKAEATKSLNLDSGGIVKVCQGKRKTCGGFIWREK